MANFEPSTNAIRDGIEHDPGGGKALMNAADIALLLPPHAPPTGHQFRDFLPCPQAIGGP